MLNIKTFYFNPYRECTYIVSLGDSSDCLIIDPGMYGESEERRFYDYLTANNLTPLAVLITHTHPDHICGLESIDQHYPNLPHYGTIYTMPADINDEITVSGFTFRLIPTPGHKEDCLCFYFEQDHVLFTGDTLFQESVGRTDLPGGDIAQLTQSLNTLCQLPEQTQVYPGHGYPTTIEHEKEYNPYI